MIVRKDISELWLTDLSGHAVAAVEAPLSKRNRDRLQISDNYFYFNAGMLLINLRKWRESHAFDQFMAFLRDKADLIKWWDQDVLNAVLHTRLF